ncbi:MAG: (Fe-S)-binding protein, partial [Actinomycetota bacterium]
FGLAFLRPRQRLVRAAATGLGLAQAAGLDRLLPRRRRAATPRVSLAELRTPLPAAQGDGPTALLLTGCVMDVAFRPVHRATLRLLAGSGYRAVPAAGGCCGALAMHYGRPDAAKRMARARIAVMEHADVVVANSAGCSAHMRTYGELLAEDARWAARAERFAERVRDLVEMDLRPAEGVAAGRVAVHDACHHVHAQGIAAQPRALLRAGGAELVEVPDGTRCCGAAGLYSVTQPEMSGELRRQKARAIASTGAPVVAVANPGCALQIAAGLAEVGAPVRVAHPAELLAPAEGASATG